MTCFIENETCDLITKGYVDDIAQHLLRLWLETKGQIDDPNFFSGVAPYFVRLSSKIPKNDTPVIRFVGKKSLLGRSVKRSHANRFDRRKLFSKEHRTQIRASYEKALWEPSLQILQDEFATDDGITRMTYERLSLCFTAASTSFLVSYSKLLDNDFREHPSDPTHQIDHSLPQLGPTLLSKEGYPIVDPLRGLMQSHKPMDTEAPRIAY